MTDSLIYESFDKVRKYAGKRGYMITSVSLPDDPAIMLDRNESATVVYSVCTCD